MKYASSLIFLITLYCGCGSLQIANFPLDKESQFQPYLTSQVNYQRNLRIQEEVTPPLREQWNKNYSALPSGGFTIVDRWLFFGTNDGRFIAASLEDGSTFGDGEYGISCSAPPTIYKNIVYQSFDLGDHGLVAYDVSQGQTIWKLNKAFSESSPIVIDQKVFHQSVHGQIFCFNYLTGEQIWHKALDTQFRNSMAMKDNIIITAGLDGIVNALEYTSGVVLWELQLDTKIMADPVIDSNKIYLATYEGFLLILGLQSGEILDEIQFETGYYQSPTIDDDYIYMPNSDGKLSVLDKTNFSEIWAFKGEGPISDSPLVTQSYVYFSTLGGHLYVLDKKNGTLLQDIKLKGRATSSPAISNGKLFLACERKKVIAYAENK